VNVPGLRAGKDLPVGVQVIAPFGCDARALMAARFVEAAIARR
jgi:Asp-tRNA(Asn)/Glu-tRNA(Gln) amidotransferase A subunit family amidase